MFTPYEQLEVAKITRDMILKLRILAAEGELTESEKESLLALAITTLQKSHL